jgi:hypothetical protein
LKGKSSDFTAEGLNMIGGDNGNAGNISERQTKVVKVKDVRMEPSKSHII